MVDTLLIDNYDKLILHCDGTDGSTAFRDSATGKVVTAVGTAQVDTAQSKFGGASLLLDGNSDKLTVADSADFDFGTGDFTVDCWVRFAADPSAIQPVIVAIGPDAGGLVISVVSKEPYLYFGSTAYGFSGTTYFAVDTWCHLAVVRSGNNLLTFMDGVQVDSDDVTGKSHATSTGMTIGKDNAGTGFDWFNGWIDEVRVSKGIARWTANFTPPDAAYYGREVYIASSTWTVPSNVSSVKALVVAGGGGGGKVNGGGGGAGGLVYSAAFAVTPAANLTVTVGAGGAGSTGAGGGTNGGNSVFGTLTAIGGGGGGGGGAGHNGGSAGGGGGIAADNANGTATQPGSGSGGFGYNGGDGATDDTTYTQGGGGGGAGAVGANATGNANGHGGAGKDYSAIFGTSVGVAGWFAGGGGGSGNKAGNGGQGGGGAGAIQGNGAGTIGTSNTGGGAGGSAYDGASYVNGVAGGSGIVILSYVYSTAKGGIGIGNPYIF